MESTGEALRYLKAKLETDETGEQENPRLEQILGTPLGEVLYQQEGEVSIGKPPLSLSFSYCPAKKIPHEVLFALARDGARYPEKGDYRELDRFVLTNKSTGKSLDLTHDLAKNKVFFYHQGGKPPICSCVIYPERTGILKIFGQEKAATIVLSAHIECTRIIYELLHELGHINNGGTSRKVMTSTCEVGRLATSEVNAYSSSKRRSPTTGFDIFFIWAITNSL